MEWSFRFHLYWPCLLTSSLKRAWMPLPFLSNVLTSPLGLSRSTVVDWGFNVNSNGTDHEDPP